MMLVVCSFIRYVCSLPSFPLVLAPSLAQDSLTLASLLAQDSLLHAASHFLAQLSSLLYALVVSLFFTSSSCLTWWSTLPLFSLKLALSRRCWCCLVDVSSSGFTAFHAAVAIIFGRLLSLSLALVIYGASLLGESLSGSDFSGDGLLDNDFFFSLLLSLIVVVLLMLSAGGGLSLLLL
ncbi:hypothetical protein PS15m_001452 [Mucor circinelloides]